MISSFIRMGKKYQFEQLCSQSLAFLKDHFTTDYDQWMASTPVPPTFELKHAIGVVNLARLAGTGYESILPTALLVCCLLSGDELVNGFEGEDGTRVTLSAEDLVQVIDAKDKLRREVTDIVIRSLAPLNSGMTCWEGGCEAENILHFPVGVTPMGLCPNNPFDRWETCPRSYISKAMCDECEDRHKTFYIDGQRDLWKRLPAIFGLSVPNWLPQ